MRNEKIFHIIYCIRCKSSLKNIGDILQCSACATAYHIQNGVCITTPIIDRNDYDAEIHRGLNRLKTFIKRSPKLWTFLTYTIGTVMYGGLSAKKAMRMSKAGALPQDPIIVNVGSGTRRYSDEIINVDIFPFKNVDVVADARALPFRDNSVDMVISEFLLEHVPSPELVAQEIGRIVKRGGYIYITVPFLHPYHGSPNDFKRWTWTALEKDFSSFAPLRIGVRAGPMSALLTLLTYWLAILFSFRSQKLYLFFTQFFMVLLSPIKIFDVVFRLFPQSIDAADRLYLWGRKK
jgi:SAM-dependent methyltransferase